MNIAIIDADLIGRTKHRFPNLVCMKLSAYYKSKGHEVRVVKTKFIKEKTKWKITLMNN